MDNKRLQIKKLKMENQLNPNNTELFAINFQNPLKSKVTDDDDVTVNLMVQSSKGHRTSYHRISQTLKLKSLKFFVYGIAKHYQNVFNIDPRDKWVVSSQKERHETITTMYRLLIWECVSGNFISDQHQLDFKNEWDEVLKNDDLPLIENYYVSLCEMKGFDNSRFSQLTTRDRYPFITDYLAVQVYS